MRLVPVSLSVHGILNSAADSLIAIAALRPSVRATRHFLCIAMQQACDIPLQMPVSDSIAVKKSWLARAALRRIPEHSSGVSGTLQIACNSIFLIDRESMAAAISIWSDVPRRMASD